MRLREAMAIANEKFGVPMLLEPEDFKNPAKMDELAVIVYLTVMATILHAKVCPAREMRSYIVSQLCTAICQICSPKFGAN